MLVKNEENEENYSFYDSRDQTGQIGFREVDSAELGFSFS